MQSWENLDNTSAKSVISVSLGHLSPKLAGQSRERHSQIPASKSNSVVPNASSFLARLYLSLVRLFGPQTGTGARNEWHVVWFFWPANGLSCC
jgi:hypothetical protein